MRHRRANYRRVKIHRCYTAEEAADVLGVHKNTVFQWIKAGLPTCDDRRPKLILGHELTAFLKARRTKHKRTCRPGEIYCVGCRAPRLPAGDMADYEPITEKFGNLKAICSQCDSIMNRRASMAKLALVRGKMDITFPQALRRISESNQPTVNSDLG
jgi:DNA-binding XRE family transcriptional regulator